jgi:outer membrane protein OmpA-like peptidoglycan-associated protein
MKLFAIAVASLAAALAAPALAKDAPGAKDHPLVGRYAGSEIVQYKSAEFDEQRLVNAPLDLRSDGDRLTDANSLRLEGKVTRIRYDAPKDRSSLEILRNYEESLRGKGFEPVYACANETCFRPAEASYRFAFVGDDGAVNYRYGKGVRYFLARLSRAAGDVYAAVTVAGDVGTLVRVTVVEAKPMQMGQIAFVDAGAMAQAISSTGRVALYGVQFDFDKADIRPESRPTLDEIGKYLKANPAASLVVAGHTDGKGGFDYNLDLSRRRAAAVVADLVAHYGVAAARLTPFGVGMASPVASNDDEAGRAKNRRVELVKRAE